MWQLTHKISCEECRNNYEDDDRQPPCEEKGKCPINAIELLPENQTALDLWHDIKAFGSDLVFKLTDLTLTKFEAEELMHKLSIIESIVTEFQNSEKESG